MVTKNFPNKTRIFFYISPLTRNKEIFMAEEINFFIYRVPYLNGKTKSQKYNVFQQRKKY